MRQIKFRAESILDKSEGGGGLVEFELFEIGNWDSSCDVFYADGVPCKISSISQFTGLLDKNGKEIWEGDIVKTVDDGNCEVIFDGGRFGIEVSRASSTEDGTEYYPEFMCLDYEGGYSARITFDEKNMKEEDVLEIIGNIFEHPNL